MKNLTTQKDRILSDIGKIEGFTKNYENLEKELEEIQERENDIETKKYEAESDKDDLESDIGSEIEDFSCDFDEETGIDKIDDLDEVFEMNYAEAMGMIKIVFSSLKFKKRKSKDLDFAFVKTEKGKLFMRKWKGEFCQIQDINQMLGWIDSRPKNMNKLMKFLANENAECIKTLIVFKNKLLDAKKAVNKDIKFKETIADNKIIIGYNNSEGLEITVKNQYKVEEELGIKDNTNLDINDSDLARLYVYVNNKTGELASVISNLMKLERERESKLENIKSELMEKFPILIVERL